MNTIAMLHHKNNPDGNKKAYACAAVAKMEGIDFFYFSYEGIHFEEKSIIGWVYENGQWTQRKFSFPDVIINLSGPRTESQQKMYRELKKMIPFTSHPVGNKMKVYRKVLKQGEFSQFLIPTFKLKKFEKLLELIGQHKRIVIKPFSGNQGKKVYFIDRLADNTFKLTDGEAKRLLNHEEFNQFINELKQEQNYLCQPFIECKTRTGLSYDFRLHVQKNGCGAWEVNLIYPRISGNEKLISNVSGGGYRGELVPFLKQEFGDEFYNIKRLLDHFAITFSSYLESLYKHPFDELGIDVGIDQHQKLWVYEVNWRPGSKHREFEVAKRLVKYAIYIANRH